MKCDKTGSFEYSGHKIGWKLRLLFAGNETLVCPDEMQSFMQTETENGFLLQWTGHPVLGTHFQVSCRWKKQGDSLRGKLSFSNAPSAHRILEILFPVVVMEHPDDRILLPHDIGYLSGPLNSWDLSVSSPARYSFHPFQFFGFFSEHGCLYASCRDNRHWNKSFELTARENPRQAELAVAVPVKETAAARKQWSVPFETELAPCGGSWFDAALRYRKWAFRQSWYRNRLRSNPLSQYGIWFWNRGEADDVMVPVEEFVRRSGVPAALDWYFWHSNPYDTDYPAFWPPRAGEKNFRDAIARMARRNIFLQVYINGVIWDLQNKDWENGGEESAVKTPDGTVFSVPFNRYNGHRLAYICGEGKIFFDKIRALVDHLVDAGLKSVYLDLIGCASTVIPCYNPAHRHAPGGGTYQADGYRDMIRSLRQKHAGVAFSTEEGSEKYLDLMESMILLYPSHERIGFWNLALRMKGEYVPAFTAVYHGSTALFGNFAVPDNIPAWDPLWPEQERFRKEDEQDWVRLFPDQFPLEFSRGIIWGMQPTVCNLRKGQENMPELAPYYQFMIDCARFYYENRDFLFHGTMEAPGRLKVRSKKVRILQRGTYSKKDEVSFIETESPVILHSCWKSPSGQRKLILINWDQAPAEWSMDGLSGILPPLSCAGIVLSGRRHTSGADMNFIRKTEKNAGLPAEDFRKNV